MEGSVHAVRNESLGLEVEVVLQLVCEGACYYYYYSSSKSDNAKIT